MKSFSFILPPKQIKYSSSIRGKLTLIDITIEIIRYLNIIDVPPTALEQSLTDGKIFLEIVVENKMSRIFISDGTKIHSWHFPFQIKRENEKNIIMYRGFHINNAICDILAASFHKSKDNLLIDDILDQFWSTADDFEIDRFDRELCEMSITHLLTFEPGYLRFDYDKDREDHNHPLNHLDINYKDAAHFKLGLSQKYDCQKLISLLGDTTTCPQIVEATPSTAK